VNRTVVDPIDIKKYRERDEDVEKRRRGEKYSERKKEGEGKEKIRSEKN
jgi:hypothetical protein